MKAMVYTQYGAPDVLHLRDVPQPTSQANQVLVKIRAASVNAADVHLLRADPFLVRFESGLFAPKRTILGADIAGVVAAVGSQVTRFRVGDAVYGDLAGCGFGGFAEYVAVPESVLARKPSNLTFEEAAAVPMAAVTALQGLRDKGMLRAGQRVAINGASGGVGTFAIQLAKVMGAHVTAICSTGKMEMVRGLGADVVLDYTQVNFTQQAERYDVILGVNGFHPLGDYQRVLTPTGRYVNIGGTGKQIFQALALGPLRSKKGGQQLGNLLAKANADDLAVVTEMVEAGKLRVMIDRCYPLESLVEAFRVMDAGHARGKVVISVAQD
jgi:NADPH:quinone reductase-like Zn-dependent oxidoreductase